MKRLLKIGEKIYAQSLQENHTSYSFTFPQRSSLLLHFITSFKIEYFSHGTIRSTEDITNERKKLLKILSAKKYDYLLIDNPLSIFTIPKDSKVPIAFDCIDWYEEMYEKEFGRDTGYILLQKGMRETLKRANKIIVQSPVLKKEIEKRGTNAQLAIVPNGYDPFVFKPFAKSQIQTVKKRISNAYNLSLNGKSIIVYTGKLGKWYNDVKLIAKAITKRQIFLIVGDGPIRPEIKTSSNVVCVGAVTQAEVPEFTNIADVLVFPVASDCSPIAISEYLAVGKPIVMARGRMNWLLSDRKTGSLVENTVKDWQAGIARALTMEKACFDYNIRLGKNLTWQLLASKFSSFLSDK